MKPRSAKSKGRRLQSEVQSILLEHFRDKLETDDIKVAIMGESGEDIKLSPAARRLFPYSIECKNQEKINIWSALSQAEKNAKENTDPLLIFKRNHSEIYVSLSLKDFLNLLGTIDKSAEID